MTSITKTPVNLDNPAASGMATVYRYFKDTYDVLPALPPGDGPAGDPGQKRGLAGFRANWAKLTDDDKAGLRAGITDGTLTY